MLRSLLQNPSRYTVAGDLIPPKPYLRLFHHKLSSKTPIPACTSPPSPNLTVSFFRTSCGLTPSAALTAATKIKLRTIANAETVLGLLKDHGFTKSHMAIIAAKIPEIFTYNPEKCIGPKLKFFSAAGYGHNNLANLIARNPRILMSSLKRRICPNFNLVRNILGGDREAAAASIALSSRVLITDSEKYVVPNMETLVKHGVSRANVARIFAWCPAVMTLEHGQFSKTVALVQETGFEPSKSEFVRGIHAIAGLSRATWERKLQLYGSLGWSEEEITRAFRRHPLCMLHSEEKIRKVMGFFVENLDWKPSRLALRPILLSLSLEKRIVPRYAVFNILTSMGLTRTNVSFPHLLMKSDSTFMKNYVYKYSDEVPELLDLYKIKSE